MRSGVKIDFVILWANDNDKEWREQESKARLVYKELLNKPGLGDADDICRYRDMGVLNYWFRAVERFAPWVNKVFFVTCGQKPNWLNEANPKLVMVDHKDFIPQSYLPTFNARCINLNLHRIPELAEHYVLFDDDQFLLKPVTPELFFRNGDPVLPCDLKINRFYGYNEWSSTVFNDTAVVSEHFDLRQSIWENRHKWFDFKELGIANSLMNYVCYRINKTMDAKNYEHLATPHLKSTLQEVWDKCECVMDYTSNSRFRSYNQVNQFVLCFWNMAKGRFSPIRSWTRGKAFAVSSKSISAICDTIKKQSSLQVCLNDSRLNDNPEKCFNEIKQAFDVILPDKSYFEK